MKVQSFGTAIVPPSRINPATLLSANADDPMVQPPNGVLVNSEVLPPTRPLVVHVVHALTCALESRPCTKGRLILILLFLLHKPPPPGLPSSPPGDPAGGLQQDSRKLSKGEIVSL